MRSADLIGSNTADSGAGHAPATTASPGHIVRRTSVVWEGPPESPAPTRVLVGVLTAELVTAVSVIASSSECPVPETANLATAAYLAALGLTATEVTVRHVAAHSPITSASAVNLSSVWTVAGALLLHPALAAALVVVLHTYHHSRAPGRSLRSRILDIAGAVLACLAARAAYTATNGHLTDAVTGTTPGLPHAVPVVMAVACFAAVHRAGRTAIAALDNADPGRDGLGVAAPCLGGFTAASLAVHPLLAPCVLPALFCLHRAVLARQLEQAGRLDPKTGLLTAVAWHVQAQRVLNYQDPGEGAWALLVVDLDHFKVINDTHGHVAGDTVLAAIADALCAEVRDGDLVGRFGGDEFVVLLTGPDLQHDQDSRLRAVVDRVLHSIASLQVQVPTRHGDVLIVGLSVSIGGAPVPDRRSGLASLFQLADAALYEAKRSRRGPAFRS